jgi:uncharacterized repeat protein (TIGR03803 family)
LLEGSDGRLYGTAEIAGPQNGAGVVFALNKDGGGFVILHSFVSTPTLLLRTPKGALVQSSDGTLYGTASAGGSAGFGGVFKLKPDGTGIRTHASSHHYGFGVVFTSYALDLKHIEGAVQETASIKRHWQRASSAIAGGSTRDSSSGGKRISLSPMPIYLIGSAAMIAYGH